MSSKTPPVGHLTPIGDKCERPRATWVAKQIWEAQRGLLPKFTKEEITMMDHIIKVLMDIGEGRR